jgi:hypothetical protein
LLGSRISYGGASLPVFLLDPQILQAFESKEPEARLSGGKEVI